jgi:hypothetical protein
MSPDMNRYRAYHSPQAVQLSGSIVPSDVIKYLKYII